MIKYLHVRRSGKKKKNKFLQSNACNVYNLRVLEYFGTWNLLWVSSHTDIVQFFSCLTVLLHLSKIYI